MTLLADRPTWSQPARAEPWLDVFRLVAVVLADAAFVGLVAVPLPPASVARVVDPYLFDWLWVPAMTSVFVVPLVAYGAFVSSALRLWRDRVTEPWTRRLTIATLVLSVAGFAAYVSPWGIEATRWLLSD